MVSKTMEGASKTVKGSRVRKIRISEGRSDQVSSVGRDVTTFVIRVDGQITSNAFLDFVLFITQLVGKVASPIEVLVSSDDVTTLIEIGKIPVGDKNLLLCKDVCRSRQRFWASWR